jgi:uncharacterized DUF497 family protein
MNIDYDPAKNQANMAKHRVSFEEAQRFDWQTAQVVRDTRVDYGETRYIAQGFIGPRLHILIFTLRGGRARIIRHCSHIIYSFALLFSRCNPQGAARRR